MSANCPRCAKPLQDQQLDELSFRCCLGCKGMLILHPELIDVLDKSWHAVPKEKAETVSFYVKDGWQDAPAFPCPDCHQTMEKYGYMGIGAIQINRCDPCNLIWLDTDELQNMVLALAKTNYRSEAAWQESRRENWDVITPAVQADPTGQMMINHSWFSQSNDGLTVPVMALLSLLFR
jgi:Zn-finger nucleic acid-binding protein